MALPLVWTDAADCRLRRMRAEGATWDEIAACFRVNRSTVISRGFRVGARPPPKGFRPPRSDPARPPLAAGSEASWGALTAGTLLAGTQFRAGPWA